MKKYVIKKNTGQPEIHYHINYKAELNPQQYHAVTSTKGSYLVIAGAGTGKTRTLIYRLSYLVENNVDPQSILLLTFTRKAAQEIMRRAASILDDRCKKVSGGTFHSFANSILRKYAFYIQMHPNFTIIDRADAEDIINIIRTELNLNKKDRRFPRKNTLLDMISKSINKDAPIEDILFKEYPQYKEDYSEVTQVAQRYAAFKKEKMVMDYDDLLVNLKKLLETNPEVKHKISGLYKYIMVDEYQDTNKLQAEITLLLASEHRNVMVVGDDSQSIYSFRGANFRNIMDFPKLFPDTTIITLEQNYRSIPPILDLTNAVIEHAKEKYSRTLFSEINGTQKPVYINTVDEQEQAAFIAHRVLELREEGVALNKIAVLFRASWHSNQLELELKRANIPYVKYGGLKFAEAAHVKDVIAYLRVIANPFDEIAWTRILLLLDGIGPSSATKVVQKVFQSGGDINALISDEFNQKKFANQLAKLHRMISQNTDPQLKPTAQLEAVLKYYDPIFEKTYDDSYRRRVDLDSMLNISERYTTLEHMLSEMALEPPDTSQIDARASDQEDEKLVLSTIHSAKGLEWHTVFLIHLVDGYFPSMKSLDEVEDVEEERRLFYVATTRAQHNLYLITPELESRSNFYWSNMNSTGLSFSEPSRFLTEIPNLSELTEPGILEFEDNDPF
ncbi:MAG: ATP-dependent helicase [Candidatus Omnitrophota bacterium]